MYTQQECLDHPDIAATLGRQRPEYVVRVTESNFWVIEAKATREKIDVAIKEAVDYASCINKSPLIKASIATGVAGNDEDGYIVRTVYINTTTSYNDITYNNRSITGLLSPDQARHLIRCVTNKLNELETSEPLLLSIAEEINEELHRASINKDMRATVMSAVLLSMINDTLPDFNGSPDLFIKDINNRAEDALIKYGKRVFADYIELRLPQEDAAKEKYKCAVAKVYFLLRKINVKAAMDSSHDLLGHFYEVFLKYGNGAKDIGIVLTPRHITEFSAEVLDVTGNDVVYDPACGTGGFLVAAYDRVRRLDLDNVEMFKKHRIFGVEQQANVAALALVNMIFRGDGKNNIINGDCLSLHLNRKIKNSEISAEYQSLPGDRKPVTKVLMNPPFALRRDSEQEFIFIEHALDQMEEGGLLLSIIPISVMYDSGPELAWRRRVLSGNTLVAVISFQNDLFYPQASVESAIVIFRKGEPHRTDELVLFARITDDGYVKKKKRRLSHCKTSQLTELTPHIKSHVHRGFAVDIPGVIQAKPLNYNDSNMELIPQQYLDPLAVDDCALYKEICSVHAELVFSKMRGF